MFGFKKKASKRNGPKYAFCERATASAMSPHHIRQLSDAGMFRSGGADTLSLCGEKMAWDTSELDVAELPRFVQNSHDNWRVCLTCAAVLLPADSSKADTNA